MIPFSNTGYPQAMDFLHVPGDSFARYLMLEKLDETKFDATGYTFDFFIMEGSVKKWRFLDISPVTTATRTYIPLLKEQGVINKEGFFTCKLIAKVNGVQDTWLEGRFVNTYLSQEDMYSDDVIIIDSPNIEVRITTMLQAPAEVENPEEEEIIIDGGSPDSEF